MKITAIQFLRNNDPVLNGIIDLVDLPDLPVSQGVYHDVVSCIVDQQIPGRLPEKTDESSRWGSSGRQ
jgi:DNA-3-methyladenine glycosylase II